MANIEALEREYRRYIDKIFGEWREKNRMRIGVVYEVMRPEDRAEVHRRIDCWKRYITPLAEAWWRERGYGVEWPDDDSKPMKVYVLETVQ